MYISSIICEYNPFHNGHKYIIDKMRQNGATHIIACMGGNFTQRGDLSVFDKWTKTKTALLNGVDLVISLPITFSLAGAERFAYGGVYLLNALNIVNEICFGSECGNIDILKKAALSLSDFNVEQKIKYYSSLGITFAAARQKSVCDIFGKEISDILKSPNNILALEYLKALQKLKSNISPKTVNRIGAEHDSEFSSNNIASASYIRKLIYDNNPEYLQYIPQNIKSLLCEKQKNLPEKSRFEFLEQSIMYRLRMMNKDDFALLPDMSEGLENRLYNSAYQSLSVNQTINLSKCKRYTYSRIQRSVLYAFLGITKNDLCPYPPYIRVLGFNQNGREILRLIRNSSTLPVVMRYADIKNMNEICKKEFSLECRCDDIYSLSEKNILKCGKDCTENIIII